MKRRLTAFLLAVLMAVSAGVTSAVSEGERYTQSRDRLLDDLLEYICATEQIFGGELWVIEAFDLYDADRSYENLRAAGARLFAAEQALSAASFPEMKMTKEDISFFMKMDIDVTFMNYNPWIFDSDRQSMMDSYTLMRYFFMLGSLDERDWNIGMRKLGFEKQYAEYDLRYLALMADWTMASLNDPGAREEFDRKMAERCPLTYAYRSDEPRTPEEIETETDILMTSMEEMVTEASAITGAMNDSVNRMTDLLTAEDFSAADMHAVYFADKPPVLPYPAFYTGEDFVCVWKEDGAEVSAPASGTVPLRMPDEWRISMTGVGNEEFGDYIDLLGKIGAVCVESSEEGDAQTLVYELGGSRFTIMKDGGKAVLSLGKDNLLFAPEWYWYVMNTLSR